MQAGHLVTIDNYTYDPNHDFLGAGAFGKVYKAKQKQGQEVALKILDMRLFKDQFMIDSLKNEIRVMKALHSQNVVQIIEAFGNKSQTYIAIEFCPEGDLRKYLRKHGNHLQEDIAIQILKHLMNGFQELVQHNYIHRDIKPENCLVKNGIFKVSDFGFATKVDINGRQILKECVGTPLYMSPQLLSQNPYSAKSDIWSIGMVFYEMLFGKTPWPCRDKNSFLMNIKTQPLKFPFEKNISNETKDFLRQCLAVSEDSRIGWDQIFKHPILISQVQEKEKSKFKLDKQAKHILRKLQDIVFSSKQDPKLLFKSFDSDKSNTLDEKEFYHLLQAIDQKIQPEVSQYLFKMINTNNDSHVDFNEFQKLIFETDFSDIDDKASQIIVDLKEIIKANNLKLVDIFKNFDKDKQGTLDIKEFSQLLRVIAPALKDYEVEEVFKKFDQDNDKSISFEEFKHIFSKGTGQSQQQQKADVYNNNQIGQMSKYQIDLKR